MSTVTAPIGLEIWLTGTPAELDAAAYALARIGRIAYRSERYRLAGAGRFRVYVRIQVAHKTRPGKANPVPGGAVLFELEDQGSPH